MTLAARFLSATVAVALGSGAAWGQTNDSPTQRANKMAYDAAMKCFVANGHASGLQNEAGHPKQAERYTAGARTSFDAAQRLGKSLGYSSQRISDDIQTAQTRELLVMMRNDTYFREAVATCRALKLMPANLG